jgi:hypothetical protein
MDGWGTAQLAVVFLEPGPNGRLWIQRDLYNVGIAEIPGR